MVDANSALSERIQNGFALKTLANLVITSHGGGDEAGRIVLEWVNDALGIVASSISIDKSEK